MNARLSDKLENPVPDVIKLAVYGILGGLAGKPVSITFRDWPNDLLASFWGHLTSSFPTEQIAEVWSQSDIQKLKNTIQKIRVVLRYPSNGRLPSTDVIDWMIEKRRATGGGLPTVFSDYHAMSNETPGPTLLARCTPLLSSELTKWLNNHSLRPLLLTATEDPLPRIGCDHLIKAIQLAEPDGQPLSLRNAKIIEGLVAGILLTSPRELLRRDAASVDATPA